MWLSWLPSVLLPLLPHSHLSSPYCKLQPAVLHHSFRELPACSCLGPLHCLLSTRSFLSGSLCGLYLHVVHVMIRMLLSTISPCSSLQQSLKCLPSMSFTDLHIHYLFIYPLLNPTEVLENQMVLALWLSVAKGT